MTTEKHGDSKASWALLLKLMLVCMTTLSNIVWLSSGVPELEPAFLSGNVIFYRFHVVGRVLWAAGHCAAGVIHLPFTCPAELSSVTCSNTWMKSCCEKKGNKLCLGLERENRSQSAKCVKLITRRGLWGIRGLRGIIFFCCITGFYSCFFFSCQLRNKPAV